ncbi:hypothetical protein BP6252_06109 [Coleophoma cylindrospora]|uniref:Adenylosuccinate synthetase n=1 Tax=Coleophoma cylindrospora TaxID=1849047 RepID=A0A3D8RLN3_9HELO|nr:hypothetical protein BP6252_06109 [Coleophoma cylindrospora]
MAVIVLGAEWGDEGKGKLVDILTKDAKLVARAQGGNNAGHTISLNGKSDHFHLLPSGLMSPTCQSLISSGVIVHILSFFKELTDLKAKGLKNVRDQVKISDYCHISLNVYSLVDGLEEAELGKDGIRITKHGIRLAYSTKASRSGIRICNIFNKKRFDYKIRVIANSYKKRSSDPL